MNLFLEKNSNIAWILEGALYDIPNNSCINSFEKNQTTSKHDNLASFKIISKNEGIVKLEKNTTNTQIENFKIINCLSLIELPVYKNKKDNNLILETENGTQYTLQKLPKKIKTIRIFIRNKKCRIIIPLTGWTNILPQR